MLQGSNWTQFRAKDETVRSVLHKNKDVQNPLLTNSQAQIWPVKLFGFWGTGKKLSQIPSQESPQSSQFPCVSCTGASGMVAELNGFWFATLALPGIEMHMKEKLSADKSQNVDWQLFCPSYLSSLAHKIKKFHWIMSTPEGILIASASTQQSLFQTDISQQLIPVLVFLINYREIPVPLKNPFFGDSCIWFSNKDSIKRSLCCALLRNWCNLIFITWTD